MCLGIRNSLKQQTKKEFTRKAREFRLKKLNKRSWFQSSFLPKYSTSCLLAIIILAILYPLWLNIRLDIITLKINLSSSNFLDRLSNTLILFTIIFTLIGIALSSLTRKDKMVYEILIEESYMNLTIFSLFISSIINIIFALFWENMPSPYMKFMILLSFVLFIFTISLTVICFYRILTVLRTDLFFNAVAKRIEHDCYKYLKGQLWYEISSKRLVSFLQSNSMPISDWMNSYKWSTFSIKDLNDEDKTHNNYTQFNLIDINLKNLKQFYYDFNRNNDVKIHFDSFGLGYNEHYLQLVRIDKISDKSRIIESLKTIYLYHHIKASKLSKLDASDYLSNELSNTIKNGEPNNFRMILECYNNLYQAFGSKLFELQKAGYNVGIKSLNDFENNFYNLIRLSIDSNNYNIIDELETHLFRTSFLHFLNSNLSSFSRYLSHYYNIMSTLLVKLKLKEPNTTFYEKYVESFMINIRILTNNCCSKYREFDNQKRKEMISFIIKLYDLLSDVSQLSINNHSEKVINIVLSQLLQSNPSYFTNYESMVDDINHKQFDATISTEDRNNLYEEAEFEMQPIICWYYSVKAIQYWSFAQYTLHKLPSYLTMLIYKIIDKQFEYVYFDTLYNRCSMWYESLKNVYSWTSWDIIERLDGVTITPHSVINWVWQGFRFDLVIKGLINDSFDYNRPKESLNEYYKFAEGLKNSLSESKKYTFDLETLLELDHASIIRKIDSLIVQIDRVINEKDLS